MKKERNIQITGPKYFSKYYVVYFRIFFEPSLFCINHLLHLDTDIKRSHCLQIALIACLFCKAILS